jgi:hypothetical protein
MISEKYWRVPVTAFGIEYIVGLEIRPTDGHKIITTLRNILRYTVDYYVLHTFEKDNFYEQALEIESTIVSSFGARHYFIEVGKDDDHWVQLYYPSKLFQKDNQ